MSSPAAPPGGKPFKIISPEFHVIQTSTDGEFRQAMAVRYTVFCDEQGYARDDEEDEDDKDCVHFLLVETSSGTPIGTVRFLPSRSKLGRLAVLPEWRKYNLGAALVRVVKDYAVRAGMDRGEQEVQVVCHSQAYVVGFYEKLGFRPIGERFLEEGTEHQKMKLSVPI